jgi:prepilin-type N-terminal cleavage/methylation domain-containing protein
MKRAFTLTELVVVMCMLAILTLIIATTLWGATKIERADAALLLRMTVQGQLADRFREDVGRAVSCPDSARDLTAGPECLILQMAQDSLVVYRWSGSRLVRREIKGNEETASSLGVGGSDIEVQFERNGSAGLVTLRLIEMPSRGALQQRRPLDVTAALGADLR